MTNLNANFSNEANAAKKPKILAKFAQFAPFALKSNSVANLKIAITYKVTTTRFRTIAHTAEVDAIAGMLETVSANKWTLMDLSMRESALEEIYIKFMTNE